MNKTFHTTNRLVASSIRFPRVAQTGPQTLQVMPKGHITKVTSLQCMPSKSTCEDMLKTIRLGKYSAVSCNLGTFDIPSLEAIRNLCSRPVGGSKQRSEGEGMAGKNGGSSE